MSDTDKPCFVIAPIGEPDSDTRKRSDQVLKHIIRPAVGECGYTAVRADEIDKPGIITSQVIQRVVGDPLVIADLTETNPNVFYELAIRHAIKKPLVQIIKKGERIPFDVAGTRTIQVDHKDLDSVESAKKEIVNQIKSLEDEPEDLETPISVSLDLQLLKQSENPEERSLADLVSAVSDLRTSMSKIEAKIGTTDEDGILDDIQRKLKSLPMMLEDYLDPMSSASMRKSRKYQFRHLRDLVHMAEMESGGTYGLLIAVSMLKEPFPWLYEVGMEVYRKAKSGDEGSMDDAFREFMRLSEFTFHGPIAKDMFGRNKDMYMFIEDLAPMMDELAHRTLKESKLRSPKIRK